MLAVEAKRSVLDVHVYFLAAICDKNHKTAIIRLRGGQYSTGVLLMSAATLMP
jgi:hypothetical protein